MPVTETRPDLAQPAISWNPVIAPGDMIFYTGKAFPKKYQGGIFVASHGSWNRTVPSGYLINYVPLNADGTAGKAEVFADGFLDQETRRAFGRPVDVANLPDGSILVSDDFAGALYRISYVGN